jgi:peroxiredoxin
MLRNGTLAPKFSLLNTDGQTITFEQIHGGKPLIILFFRGEFCPSASRDLISYANTYSRIKSLDAELIGISADTPANHQSIKEKLWVPFPLLSDPGMVVGETYGVYRSDDEGEGPDPHNEPAVFIIDVDGKIAYSQILTGPKGTADPADMTLILLYMSQNGGKY